MNVLIISFRFPPSNLVGAIRVGKLARYLHHRGHQIRVITTDIADDRSQALEIPQSNVVYTAFTPQHSFLEHLIPAARPAPTRASLILDAVPGQKSSEPPHWAWVLARRQYYAIRHIPDLRRPWTKTAIPAANRLLRDWHPDVIIASGPPHTAFLVARHLSRAHGIPWVADFRDLWTDNPYYDQPIWRKPVDALLEHFVLKSSAALITVSPEWADQIHRRHHKPVTVVYNGYAPEDFPGQRPIRTPGDNLVIRHTGTIYPGFRDPSALFSAIASLPAASRKQISVEFQGDAATVRELASAHGVSDRIRVEPTLPYRQALQAQLSSDILLLLQWNNVSDKGNLPGKLFEYLYARRPILLIGYADGIAARIIHERRAGVVSNSPGEIAARLAHWIEQKQQTGIPDLEPTVTLGFSREEQFSRLESVLTAVSLAGQ